ncbi:Acetyltransferase (GNAT) family protein [uncultured Eubacteriales bacterium]|uniref:Acetyltransferase (GNAT) family protein n=1 Tax=uncultured Eubacteriales bacterium TaxID=172733 RepID=A0A212JLT2_9FIRM|nr:Acetyltransferase (GNAT) family protein [uncultured Eubacteriales bacterium]
MNDKEDKLMITIRRYSEDDESALFSLMKNEGAEWESYWREERRDRYKAALHSCIVYVAYENDILCGYCRCRDDDGYGIYVYDLLVDKHHRGKQIGRQLMAQVRKDFSNDTVYVMSDVDEYYEKQGFRREGSIFEVCV